MTLEADGEKKIDLTLLLLLLFREEFNSIARSLHKALRDTNQMVRGGSALSAKQMQLQVGILPTIADCLDGLRTLCEMHQAE